MNKRGPKRKFGFALLGLTGLGLAGVLVDGMVACSVPEPTAIFLGVSSDMRVSEDFDAVGIFISSEGVIRYGQVHPVQPTLAGGVLLPASISILQPSDEKTPVHIRVAGYKAGNVIAVRDAITTVPSNRISVLRLPVQWLATGATAGRDSNAPSTAIGTTPDGATPDGGGLKPTTAVSLGGVSTRALDPNDESFSEFSTYFVGLKLPCPVGRTSVGGECVDVHVDPSALLASDSSSHVGEVYGGAAGLALDGGPTSGGQCFPVETCFDDAATQVPVGSPKILTATTCELQGLGGVLPSEINIALDRDGQSKALVALDQEVGADPAGGGWRISAAGNYVLPRAVCARLGKDLRGIRVSTSCAAKRAKDPTCGPWSAVKTPLKPGFAQGRYGANEDGGGEADAPRDKDAGRIDTDQDAADGSPDARFVPEEISIVDPDFRLVRPVSIAFESGSLWLAGSGGMGGLSATNPSAEGLSAVLSLKKKENLDCIGFPFLGVRGDLAAVGCYGGAPSYHRFEPGGGGAVHVPAPNTTVGGATVTQTGLAVVGTQFAGGSALKFIETGGDVQVVNLIDESASPLLGGVHDLFLVPPGNPDSGTTDGTFFFSSGVRVWSVSTRPSATGPTEAMAREVAIMPDPYNGTYPRTASLSVAPVSGGPGVLFFMGHSSAFHDANSRAAVFRMNLGAATTKAETLVDPFLVRFPLDAGAESTRPRLVADARAVYWTDGRALFALAVNAPPTPTAPRPLTDEIERHSITGIALSPNYVFWVDAGKLWRMQRSV